MERPHQGRSCGNLPPAVAFPQLPTLPSLPSVVDPDAWLQVIDGNAYVRRVGSDGCVDVDLSAYYVGKIWAGQYVTMHVDSASQAFSVWHGTDLIKDLPIKKLVGHPLPLKEFFDLMTELALADARRIPPNQRGLRQQSRRSRSRMIGTIPNPFQLLMRQSREGQFRLQRSSPRQTTAFELMRISRKAPLMIV